ncbi:MAG: polysaccharide deacetylase family protein, partial [Asgard group archaeon]|nr:polysaccharide deacetylase family protein [Asgard group archaeon]
MTVDVEDYYHVSAFSSVISTTDWDKYESRVERNTNKILELFSKYKIKATFFVLGCVAEKYPDLISRIFSDGHEIGSHGYSHQLIYKQSKKTFREETSRSKEILEDIIHQPIKGYRAASYSITSKSEWALDVLAEEGFE